MAKQNLKERVVSAFGASLLLLILSLTLAYMWDISECWACYNSMNVWCGLLMYLSTITGICSGFFMIYGIVLGIRRLKEIIREK